MVTVDEPEPEAVEAPAEEVVEEVVLEEPNWLLLLV